MTRKLSLSAVIVAVVALIGPVSDARAQDNLSTASPTQVAAIGKQLAHFGEAWRAGDAQALVHDLYTESAVVSGEGLVNILRGRKQIASSEAELIKGYSSATFELYALRAAGPGVLYSFVKITAVPRIPADAPIAKAKALYVWKKTAHGWQIDMEVYAMGEAQDLCATCKATNEETRLSLPALTGLSRLTLKLENAASSRPNGWQIPRGAEEITRAVTQDGPSA